MVRIRGRQPSLGAGGVGCGSPQKHSGILGGGSLQGCGVSVLRQLACVHARMRACLCACVCVAVCVCVSVCLCVSLSVCLCECVSV
jgi:hypothetical protein